MEPQRVIEAGDLGSAVEHRLTVRDERGVEKGHVGEIGQRGGVDRRIVGQSAADADPYRLSRLALLAGRRGA